MSVKGSGKHLHVSEPESQFGSMLITTYIIQKHEGECVLTILYLFVSKSFWAFRVFEKKGLINRLNIHQRSSLHTSPTVCRTTHKQIKLSDGSWVVQQSLLATEDRWQTAQTFFNPPSTTFLTSWNNNSLQAITAKNFGLLDAE